MPYDFTSKVTLITGAASGIGRATAQKMASLGSKQALSDINSDGLAETLQLCAKQADHYTEVSSVADSAACTRFVKNTVARFGRLDALLACPGLQRVLAGQQSRRRSGHAPRTCRSSLDLECN